ncbi:MAG: DUF3747 domain-containing protein [Synechococcales cyanobacterium RM1_1_8]|nr:DUF3747 domain-containing protein [Synechococcales cyanobacterium RM1_1_8]
MNRSALLSLAALTTTSLLSSLAHSPAQAASSTFTEAAVQPEQFIVMAAPRNSTDYNLVIVEQKSSQRPCWSEKNGIVDPLLLNFDFSGICSRATDSNGYSLRMGGEDLGLQYSLRLVNQGSYVALMAQPNRRNQAVIELGRTQTASQDYLAITLKPGWSLSRRVYDGTPLGHIYLSNQMASTIASAPSQPKPAVTAPVKPPAPPIATAPVTVPVATTPGPKTSPSPTASQPVIISVGTPLPPAPSVPPRQTSQPIPPASGSQTAGSTPVIIPVVKPPVSAVPAPPIQPQPAVTPTQPSPASNPLANQPYYAQINALYQEILERPVDQPGLKTYGRRLDQGKTLAWVRDRLSNSSEGRTVALNRVYREVLGRNVDPAGARVYGNRLKSGWTIAQVRNELLNSREAQQRLANR